MENVPDSLRQDIQNSSQGFFGVCGAADAQWFIRVLVVEDSGVPALPEHKPHESLDLPRVIGYGDKREIKDYAPLIISAYWVEEKQNFISLICRYDLGSPFL